MSQPVNELEEFNIFVQDELGGLNGITLQQAVDEFLAYRKSVAAIQNKLGQAQAQSHRGESRPLDVDALKREVRARLQADGITD